MGPGEKGKRGLANPDRLMIRGPVVNSCRQVGETRLHGSTGFILSQVPRQIM